MTRQPRATKIATLRGCCALVVLLLAAPASGQREAATDVAAIRRLCDDYRAALDSETRTKAMADVRRAVTSVCAAYGARCEIEFKKDPYPVTYNDERAAERVVRVLRKIKGARTRLMEPRLGAEDMSRFLQKAPGVFYYLGTINPSKGCTSPNHSSRFKVDEDVLKYGSVSLAAVALEFSKET